MTTELERRALDGLPVLIDVRRAAGLLTTTPRTVWRWVKEGRLPAVRLGPRTVRFRLADLRHLMDGR